MKTNQKVKQSNLFNQWLGYVLFLKIIIVSKILAFTWTSDLSQCTLYLAETGLNLFAVYTVSIKKSLTSCQVDSSRLGFTHQKEGIYFRECTLWVTVTSVLEKLEFLLTSMVWILDIQPYFFDVIYARMSLNWSLLNFFIEAKNNHKVLSQQKLNTWLISNSWKHVSIFSIVLSMLRNGKNKQDVCKTLCSPQDFFCHRCFVKLDKSVQNKLHKCMRKKFILGNCFNS